MTSSASIHGLATRADGVVPPDVAARVKAHHDELVALRRDLHAHPELSWAEVRTTRLVRERLAAAGLEPAGPARRHRPGLRHRRRRPA